jgi:hypothetical protein
MDVLFTTISEDYSLRQVIEPPPPIVAPSQPRVRFFEASNVMTPAAPRVFFAEEPVIETVEINRNKPMPTTSITAPRILPASEVSLFTIPSVPYVQGGIVPLITHKANGDSFYILKGSDISANIVQANEVITSNLAAVNASINIASIPEIVDVSSITFSPDSNVLTVSDDILYLDGLPVAQNVSGAEHWADYPAKTSVNMSGYDINNANFINTNNINVSFNLVAQFGSISSAVIPFQSGTETITFAGGDVLTVSGGNVEVNGIPLLAANSWSTFPATQSVNMSGYDLSFNAGRMTISDFPATIYVNEVPYRAAEFWSLYGATQDVNMAFAGFNNTGFVGISGGVTITASDGILYANGIPIATGGNASNWSTFRAVSGVDISGFDMSNVGSLTCGGVSETAQFGTGPAPMFAFNVRGTTVDIIQYNPTSPMTITGTGGVLISAPTSDLDLLADDINITQTGATSVMNITTTGLMTVNGGAAIEIGAVGTIQILSTGNVSIGSGNVLGADTEIEKVGFNDNEIYKAGVSDLEISDVGTINGFPYVPTQQWYTVSAQGSVDFNNNTLVDVSGVSGSVNFASIPSTAGTPTLSTNLTTKAYVDGLVSFKDTTDFYVSEQGNDTTGNGSILNPYATVQKAITEAEAISSSANICVIHIASGHYTENLTFAKGYVILVGAVSSQNPIEITEITGSISIALTVGGDDLFNKQVGFVGLNITGGITDTSTLSHTVFMQDCQVFADDRLFYVNSTSADQRTYLTNVDFNQDSGTLTMVEINNGRCQLERVDIATDNNVECLRISGDCILERMVLCSLENANASTTIAPLVRITSSTTTPHNIGQTSFVYNTVAIRVASPDSCAVLMDTGAVNPVLNFQFNFISLLGTADGFNVAIGKTAGMTGVPTILYGGNNCLPNALGSCTTIENNFVSIPLTPLTNSNITIEALNTISLSAATIRTPYLTFNGSTGIRLEEGLPYGNGSSPNALEVIDLSFGQTGSLRVSDLILGANQDATTDLLMARDGTTDRILVDVCGGGTYHVAYLEDVAYANYYSTVSQTVLAANTPTTFSFNGSNNVRGFSLSGNEVVVAKDGVYEFAPSMVFDKTGGGSSNVYMWFQKNGNDIADSCSTGIIAGNNADVLMTVPFIIGLSANDGISAVFASSDATVYASAEAAQVSPYPRPAVPSIIMTCKWLGSY